MSVGETGRIVTVLGLAVALAACTFVELKPQGQKVRVLTPSEVTRCAFLGRTTANTTARIGFIARSPAAVAEELERLARNSAGSMDGDTLVAEGPVINGERTFKVYRCINP